MHIKTRFHGILADWVGTPSASFELTQGSTLTDLILEIGRRYRQNMPDPLWDQKTNSFNQKVRAFKDTTALDPVEHSLADGDVITFMLLIAGG
jgi:molybdopterin converting factor small subunit